MIPQAVVERLDAAEPLALGFSGSRAPDPQTRAAMIALVQVVGARRAAGAPIAGLVGDGRGIDRRVREAWRSFDPEEGALTVYARPAELRGRPHAALIARSTQFAMDLAAHHPALLVAGPAKACPATITPTGAWISGQDGYGLPDVSGTWSTVGVAVGQGVPCLLFLPAGRGLIPVRGWSWQAVGAGWWWHVGR